MSASRDKRASLAFLAFAVALASVLVAGVGGGFAQTDGATFLVNNVGGGNDGSCDVEHCTLAEAIDAANRLPGPDEIHFRLPPSTDLTIRPVVALNVTDPVLIDGATQPGYPDAGGAIVRVDGSLISETVGLRLSAPTTVRALVVSGWNSDGIVIGGGAGGSVIEASSIGTHDVLGREGEGNDLNGIRIVGSGDSLIGGVADGAGNVISGNGEYGVLLVDTPDNRIIRNVIGATTRVGQGNGRGGINVDDASRTTILENTIAGNIGPGVTVPNGIGTDISQNSIAGNDAANRPGADLGIDLGDDGVTPNTDRDGEPGPNEFQNFPVLTSVTSAGDTTKIAGSLVSEANDELRIDFYVSTTCDPSGFGEGERFLGSTDVATDSGGRTTFDVTVDEGLGEGEPVTATATDSRGNTSEFSACLRVGESAGVEPMDSAEQCVPTVNGGQTIRFDELDQGVALNDVYGNIGVLFVDDDLSTPRTSANDGRTTSSPPNSALNESDVSGSFGVPLVIRFASPQSAVGFTMGNGSIDLSPLATVSAYDAAGLFLGSVERPVAHHNVITYFGVSDPLARIREVRIDYGDTDNEEEIDDLCITVPREPGASDVTLTVDRRSIPAGAHTVPLDAVPSDKVPIFFGEPEPAEDTSVPKGAPEPDSTPLARIPLARIPLARIPLARIPLARIGLDLGPAGTEPLSQLLLSTIPVPWDEILTPPSPNAGRPLQALTLQDVFDDPTVYADGSTPRSRFEAVELGDSGLEDTLLNNLSIGALSFGDLELDEIPPPDADTWCESIEAAGGDCTGVDTSQHTLVGLSIAGAPLARIPLARIPLARIPLARIPLARIPLARIDIAATPLARIALSDILPDPNLVVDCTRVDCVNGTLGDAAALVPSAIRVDAEFGDLEGALGDDVTLADIILGILPRSLFPWETFPIDGVQEYAGTGDVLGYDVDFDLDCANADGLAVNVELPDGYIVRLGTTEIQVDEGAPFAGPDPSTDAETGATWSELPDLCAAPGSELVHVRLGFEALSGFRLAALGGDATVSTGPATASAEDEAPTLVLQNLERNDDVASPPLIAVDELKIGHVARSGDLEVFRLPIPERGTRTTVFLSHVPEGADFDLIVAKPEAEPLQSAPLARIPLARIPVEDRGSSLDDSEQALPPETLEDLPLARIPLARISVGSVSANRGEADEVAELLSQGEEGFYTIIVAGYNGSFSDLPFVLRVLETPPPELPPCPPRDLDTVSDPGSLPQSLPADTRSLFLVNSQRMASLYGVEETEQMLARAAQVAARPEVRGQILRVDGNAAVRAAYDTWDEDPCSIEAANDVVRTINDVVTTYRTSLPDLQSVTLIGADEALPMARVPDLVTLSPEFDEAFDLEFTTNGLTEGNALYASAATGHVLTDNAYVAFTAYDWLGRELYLPQIAVGRLVETPAEIERQLGAYQDFDGVLDPTTALTTAYDFLTDGGEGVAEGLAGAVGAGGAVDALISDTWTRSQLLTKFTGKTPTDEILSVNAHYNHFALEPAGPENPAGFQLSDLVTTADLTPAVEDAFKGRVLFTMGCHGGLNVADVLGAEPGTEAFLADWAQSWAQRGTAVYVANTGFGYGDTEANALSERLMTLFSDRLGEQPTIGRDWIEAVHEYFTTMGAYDVYDEKALIEATFYGLPFWRVAGAEPATPRVPPTTSPVPGVPGLSLARLTIAVPAASLTRYLTPRGSFWDLLGRTTNVHYRPIQPIAVENVGVPGQVARGAIITSLVTEDVVNDDPVLALPTIDLEAHEPERTFEPIFFPANLSTITQSRQLGETRQSLVLSAGQFRPGDTSGTGSQRLVRSAEVEVAYSTSPDVTPPEIQQVGAVRTGGSAEVFARTTDTAGTGVRRVAALVNDGSGWRFIDLARVAGSDLWKATLPVASGKLEIALQSQDVAGNVGYSTDKGANFDATEDGGGPDILIDTPLPGAVYGQDSIVRADFHCSDPGGVASCVGTAANGAPINTSTLGEHDFTVVATDLAGNQTTRTHRYTVRYAFDGFLATFANPPVLNIAQSQNVQMLYWRLGGNRGLDILAPGSPQSRRIDCATKLPIGPLEATETPPYDTLTYQNHLNRYYYPWKPPKRGEWKGQCREFVLTLKDGTVHTAWFHFIT